MTACTVGGRSLDALLILPALSVAVHSEEMMEFLSRVEHGKRMQGRCCLSPLTHVKEGSAGRRGAYRSRPEAFRCASVRFVCGLGRRLDSGGVLLLLCARRATARGELAESGKRRTEGEINALAKSCFQFKLTTLGGDLSLSGMPIICWRDVRCIGTCPWIAPLRQLTKKLSSFASSFFFCPRECRSRFRVVMFSFVLHCR